MDKIKPNIFLNMILADSESPELVQRALESVKNYVDDIYITVTSKETTNQSSPLVQLLNTYGAHVNHFQWVDDFAVARNFAMEATPKGKNNFIIWMDADDVWKGAENIRPIAEDMITYNQAAVFLDYLYMVDLDEKGDIREVIIEHKRERIIRNDDTFKWIGSLHEILIEQRQENIQKVFRKESSVVHLSNQDRVSSNLERNVRILEAQARRENHKDPRTVIYLAKAYFDKSKTCPPKERKINIDLALTLFKEYLEGEGSPESPDYKEGSGWPEERSTAWSYVSEIFRMLGKVDLAVEAIQYAIREAPEFPNYYIDLCALYIMKKDMKKAKHWLKIATSVDMPETTIITLPRDLKAKALECDYHIMLAEGKLELAVRDLEMLVDIFPGNREFEERLESVKKMNEANKTAQSIVYVAKYLEKQNQAHKVENLVRAIPDDLLTEKFASEMAHQYLPKRVWADNEIAILCGPGWETWTPDSVKTGVGGSEEAVIRMSQELTKLGWHVTVYANPGDKAGDFDGVEYKMWWDINQKDEFNVLILWRQIGFADFKPNAKFILLWLHDVPNNPDFTEERIGRIDKIAVLSSYHKSLLRMQKEDATFVEIPDSKIIVTGNGIQDFSEFKEWKGDYHRMIYSSSPDRGLVYLLTNWKKIIEAVPDAKLDVYYGFAIFDQMFATNPGRMKWKQTMMDLMEQPGITYHGRVGHDELAKAFNQSGLWLYPTNFQEISCISAMKAQALGAIPIVTNFAALKETVKNGIKVDRDIVTEEGQEEYVKTVIDMLQHPEKQDEMRQGMMEWAREYFSWKKIGEDWNGLFKNSLPK